MIIENHSSPGSHNSQLLLSLPTSYSTIPSFPTCMVLLRTLHDVHPIGIASVIDLIREHSPLDQGLLGRPNQAQHHIHEAGDDEAQDPGEGVGALAHARVDRGGDAVDEAGQVGGDADEEGGHGAQIDVEGVAVDAADKGSIVFCSIGCPNFLLRAPTSLSLKGSK